MVFVRMTFSVFVIFLDKTQDELSHSEFSKVDMGWNDAEVRKEIECDFFAYGWRRKWWWWWLLEDKLPWVDAKLIYEGNLFHLRYSRNKVSRHIYLFSFKKTPTQRINSSTKPIFLSIFHSFIHTNFLISSMMWFISLGESFLFKYYPH